MAKRLLRPAQVFGPNGRLPVGRTKFYADFVATNRIRLVHLGPRAVAVVEDELDELIEDLRRKRDAGMGDARQSQKSPLPQPRHEVRRIPLAHAKATSSPQARRVLKRAQLKEP